MPTYQYACTACDERLEAVQSFTDAALTECPACGGRLRKVFSAVGVVFKGSGFYKNDSREGAKSGSSKAKDGGESSSSADSSGGDKAAGDKAGAVKAESSSGGDKAAAAPAAKGAATGGAATATKPTPAPAGKTS